MEKDNEKLSHITINLLETEHKKWRMSLETEHKRLKTKFQDLTKSESLQISQEDSKEDAVVCTLNAMFTQLKRILDPQQWMENVKITLREILPKYNFLIFKVGLQFNFKEVFDPPLSDWTFNLGGDCYTVVIFASGVFEINLSDDSKFCCGGNDLVITKTPPKYNRFFIPKCFGVPPLLTIFSDAKLETKIEMDSAYETLKNKFEMESANETMKNKTWTVDVLEVDTYLKENMSYISKEPDKIFEKNNLLETSKLRSESLENEIWKQKKRRAELGRKVFSQEGLSDSSNKLEPLAKDCPTTFESLFAEMEELKHRFNQN